MSDGLSSEDVWKAVHLYFARNSIAQPQIESYDDFVENSLT